MPRAKSRAEKGKAVVDETEDSVDISRKHSKSALSMGHIIIGLATHFGVFDPDKTTYEVSPSGEIARDLLFRAEVVTDTMALRDPTTRKCFHLRKSGAQRMPIRVPVPQEEEEEEEDDEDATAVERSNTAQQFQELKDMLVSFGGRMDSLEENQRRMERAQKRQEFLLRKFMEQSGYQIPSPPPSPAQD